MQARARAEAAAVECEHASSGILLECRHRSDRFGVSLRVGIANKVSSDAEAGRPWTTHTLNSKKLHAKITIMSDASLSPVGDREGRNYVPHVCWKVTKGAMRMEGDIPNLAFGHPEGPPGRGDICRKSTG